MADYKLRIIVEGSDAGASKALGSANKALDDLERKAKSTGASVSGSLKSMGASFTSVGKGLSLAVTTPLVGIAAVALNSAAKFEQNMNLIQASTNATGDQMKAMQQIAIDLGAKTVFSAGEAAQGLLELSYAGLDAKASMEAISGVLDLAAAGNLSVASAAETTANALNAFHLPATEATNIANMFAAAAASSSVEVLDLTQSFAASSAVFATYGQSIYDLTTGLAILGNNGIKGSDAGTSLKTMMSRLAAPTDTAAELMQNLGVQVYDASGHMRQFPAIMSSVSHAMAGLNDEQRNAAMYQIFGSDALRAASILLKEGTAGWDKMSAAVHESGKATLLADARMKGLAGAIEYWKGSVDSFLIESALPFQDFFSNILHRSADFLTSIGNLDSGTKAWAIGIGVAAAAAGPLLIVIGTLATTMGAAIPVLAAVGSALLPIGAGLATLYAAYRLNIGGLRTFVDGGLERVKKAAPLAGRALTEFVARVRSIGTNTLVTGNSIREFVGALTGSEETANTVTNGIIRMIASVDAADRAFNGAGGGLNGFLAAMSSFSGGAIKVDMSGMVTKVSWGDFVGVLDWANYVFSIKWGDFVTALDWNNKVFSLEWGNFLTGIDLSSKIATLQWGDFVGTFDWGDRVLTLGWGDYVTTIDWGQYIDKLSWSNIVTTFDGWSSYIQNVTWDEFIVDLTDWGVYVGKLTWSGIVADLKWQEYIAKLYWGDYIGPIVWSSVADFLHWEGYINKLVWSEFIDKFTWTNVSKLSWGDYIKTLSWTQYITPIGWLTYITQLAWDKYIHPLTWAEFAQKIDWLQFLTFPGWATYITGLVWDKFVPNLTWSSFLEKIGWTSFVSSLSWSDFLAQLVWSAFIPSFTWASFITTIDLRAYVPAFPGWASILSALGIGASAPAQGPPSSSLSPNNQRDFNTLLSLPKHAAGTDNFAGGWTWVGEKGPELLNLPAGSKIMSNQKSMGMIGKMADGNYAPMPPIFMPQSKMMTANPVNIANDAKMLARMTDSYNALKSIENLSRIGPDKIVQAQDKNQLKLQQSIDSMFQKAPGLMHTSDVTQNQLDMAKLGIPQNFADDWVRHLTDEVVNGVQWNDADIKDAALRAGLDPSLPAQAILGMVKDQWNSGAFFADATGNAKNTDLLNMDAIKASIAQQQQEAAGKQNLMNLSALFGGTPQELATQAQAIGGQARTGLVQGLTGAGAASSAPAVDLSTVLLGGSSTGITPEAVAPLAASFVSAFATALTGSKDDKDKGGIDFGAAIVAALTASLGNSDALAGVGQAILQKITESWKTIKDVDFIGGMAAAMALQIDTQGSIDALKNVGGKIAQLIKKGIDDYFKDAALADSISSGVSSTTSNNTPTIPGQNASGTSFWRGGLTWVGERGAELVNLPRGAQVFNNGQSMAMAGAGGGGDIHIHATINTPIDVEKLAYRVSQIQQKRGR